MEAVGYMAGGMSHNFNNNLGIILGNVELSQLKVQDPMIQGLLKDAKIELVPESVKSCRLIAAN
jgi:hypothetical protein